jgi:hypothetical protein
MAAQEMVEHLRSDVGEAEDVDGLSEGVNLAVQFARVMALFAKGKHIRPQSLCQRGVDLGLLDCSHSSARAPQITITDPCFPG